MIVIKTRSLRLLRAERQLTTLRQLSADSGIGVSHLSRLLKGEFRTRGISMRTLDRLCRALRCQPGELIEFTADEEFLPDRGRETPDSDADLPP